MTNKVFIAIIVAMVIGGAFLLTKSPSAPLSGAVTGPEVDSPFFTIGGVTKEYRSQSLLAGTTTPCSIKSPNATSTLLVYTLRYSRTSADGATTFDVTTGTTQYATTTGTISAAQAVATGPVKADVVLYGTTTSIVAPNSFIVTKYATSSLSANFANTGVCKAVFQVL